MLLKSVHLVLFFSLTLLGLLQAFIYWRFSRTFNDWPKVRAEITHSRLLDQLIDGKSECEAIIAFRYRYDGTEYKCDTPALRGYSLIKHRDFEKSMVNKYRPGDIVLARVHPRAPSVAYLEKAPLNWASLLFIPAWVALGLALIYLMNSGYFAELYSYLQLQSDLIILESESRNNQQ